MMSEICLPRKKSSALSARAAEDPARTTARRAAANSMGLVTVLPALFPTARDYTIARPAAAASNRARLHRARPKRLRLLLQHQRPLLADRRHDLLREDAEQPGQRDIQQYPIFLYIDRAGGGLAHRAHPEGQPVAGPDLFLDRQ